MTGFAVAIVAVPAGATVLSSSVASDGNRLQVGLEASTAGVLQHYVQAMTAAGFAARGSPAGAGASAMAFV